MDPACQVGTVQGHGDSIMIWGVFSWQFFGIFGTCTNLPQCDSVRRVAGSQLATAWLDEHSSDFSVMNWPPRSPVLNPIEHLWVVLEKGEKAHHTTPATLTE
ncbi:hypothetical protein AVEN_172925-1 [Araneus ventricosus]|uniref:Tc1-like transposase DDE domain-containing protein n=1 Tax=Araneus ventricosus TaxID=182803 RepID=A0A4Y2R5R5_ARAVE|nr:hypothetical protein AVEN_223573-1 [Araneus ventricosus]GBN71062.1 hypothetical protein AVEN_172925-1 [Araneus ventricosus]